MKSADQILKAMPLYLKIQKNMKRINMKKDETVAFFIGDDTKVHYLTGQRSEINKLLDKYEDCRELSLEELEKELEIKRLDRIKIVADELNIPYGENITSEQLKKIVHGSKEEVIQWVKTY